MQCKEEACVPQTEVTFIRSSVSAVKYFMCSVIFPLLVTRPVTVQVSHFREKFINASLRQCCGNFLTNIITE